GLVERREHALCAAEKIQHDNRRPAARVRSAAPGDRRFHRRSQDDCSPPLLPTAVDGGYEVFGQRSPNKVHGYAWPAVRHESTGITRSEERRVGKECRSGWAAEH